MREIAAVANVSVSTVSRALKGDPSISESRAAEIRQIAQSMNYGGKKRGAQRAVVGTLEGLTIGLISVGVSEDLLAVPTVAKAINGAEAALSEAGANVLLRHIPILDAPLPMTKLASLSGAILFGPLQGDEIGRSETPLLDLLRELPLVWTLGCPGGCWGDSVIPASTRTGALAAEYLISRGHRELAFVNPKPDHQHFMQREDGFFAQARRHGITVKSFSRAPEGGWSLPLHAPTSVAVVQGLVDEMLATTPRPTAVLAAADTVAALLYGAVQARDVVVGRDLSIISANNDESLIATLSPPLTTFDVHARQIGRTAVQVLASRMSGLLDGPDAEIAIESELVERESVADLRR